MTHDALEKLEHMSYDNIYLYITLYLEKNIDEVREANRRPNVVFYQEIYSEK